MYVYIYLFHVSLFQRKTNLLNKRNTRPPASWSVLSDSPLKGCRWTYIYIYVYMYTCVCTLYNMFFCSVYILCSRKSSDYPIIYIYINKYIIVSSQRNTDYPNTIYIYIVYTCRYIYIYMWKTPTTLVYICFKSKKGKKTYIYIYIYTYLHICLLEMLPEALHLRRNQNNARYVQLYIYI